MTFLERQKQLVFLKVLSPSLGLVLSFLMPILCLGAGTITNWANELPVALRALTQDKAEVG